MKLKHTLFVLFSLFVLILAACGADPTDPTAYNGTLLPTPIPITDFTLTDGDGQAVSLSDFRDKVVLVYFGYTFCPDVCPTTMADLGRVQRELDDAGESIQVLMITVDPQRDTPELLADYVTHFHPTFKGLAGTKQEIDGAAEQFGVFYEAHEGSEASGYLVDHTARVFVVNQEGAYELSFPFETSVEDMVADLRLLMGS